MCFLHFLSCFVNGLLAFWLKTSLPLNCQHPFKELETFLFAEVQTFLLVAKFLLALLFRYKLHRHCRNVSDFQPLTDRVADTVARLQVTWWRLGAVAGDTIGHAGY